MMIFRSKHLFVCPIFGQKKRVTKFIKMDQCRKKCWTKNVPKNACLLKWVTEPVIKSVTRLHACGMGTTVMVLHPEVVRNRDPRTDLSKQGYSNKMGNSSVDPRIGQTKYILSVSWFCKCFIRKNFNRKDRKKLVTACSIHVRYWNCSRKSFNCKSFSPYTKIKPEWDTISRNYFGISNIDSSFTEIYRHGQEKS